MRFHPLPAMIGLCLLLVATAPPSTAHPVMVKIDAALESGELNYEEALLYKFYFVFDESRLPGEFRVADAGPLKCATWLIAEFYANQDNLTPETVSLIGDYLEPGDEGEPGTRSVWFSPSGRFYFTYYTTGGNAVPAGDQNSNGIPDFVEWCGDYMDTSHDQIVNVEGFDCPPVWAGPGGTCYPILFENMGAYGYTTAFGAGRTRITLHCNFLGFPPNHDPEGNQKGAAKVTCIHEYKHASQYVTSNWSEGQWVEVDAVWQEEYGPYDVVNDYYNYLPSLLCPIRGPQNTMDPGSYEDCIWQIRMTEIYGLGIMQAYWARRGTVPENPKSTYDAVLQQYGSSWEDAWEDFNVWNQLCGARCTGGLPGYEEACDYPNSLNQYFVYGTYPDENRLVTSYRIAAYTGYYNQLSNLANAVRIVIDGPDSGNMLVANALLYMNDTSVMRVAIPLDATGDADVELSIPPSEIDFMSFILGNTSQVMTQSALVTVRDGSGAAIADGNLLARLRTVSTPNPFGPAATVISYDLPAAAPITLEVFDLTGRRVRTLIADDQVAAGAHQIAWNGRNDAGEDLESGVYYYRLQAGQDEIYRKMNLVR